MTPEHHPQTPLILKILSLCTAVQPIKEHSETVETRAVWNKQNWFSCIIKTTVPTAGTTALCHMIILCRSLFRLLDDRAPAFLPVPKIDPLTNESYLNTIFSLLSLVDPEIVTTSFTLPSIPS